MTALEIVSESRCFEGRQITYKHRSEVCDCTMRFAAYLPPAAERGRVPALYWLSGLTCTEENFSVKSGAQRYAAELGIALISANQLATIGSGSSGAGVGRLVIQRLLESERSAAA